MTRAEVIRIHNAIDRDDPQSYVRAANLILAPYGQKTASINRAVGILQTVLHSLLNADKYTEAALLCWGTTLFNPLPRSVRMIWEALMTCAKILVMGAGSMGKSYTAIVWALLSWVRDPEYTAVKLVSTTQGHAKANTFSTLMRFHKDSKVPLPGFAQAGFIGLSTDDKHSAITMIAIPTGDDGKGRLQGFHPLPRRDGPHPVFGPMSRVILIIDEAEDAPVGLWQGVGNMLGNRNLMGSVTVYGATNPKRKDSAFAQRAEPVNGWDSVDIERSEGWNSRLGWKVLRLDGKKCENVMEGREVFPGLLTKEGYDDHVAGGTNTADYYTFARGWYPEQGATYSIFQPYVTQEMRGIYTFERVIANFATLDPAFAKGGDEAIMTTGRYGIAIGFQPFGGGEYQDFRDNPRYAAQVEQQFQIEKGKATVMAQDIIKTCRMLKVAPEWFAMDKSGNARGLFDILTDQFGDILGVEWGEAATDKKILEEDNEVANERYSGIDTEMWFAAAAWSEYGFLKLAPIVPTSPLFTELIGRQYRPISKTLQKTESKDEFKLRNGGKSPDHADSLILVPHLIRMRASTNTAVFEKNREEPMQHSDPYAELHGLNHPENKNTSHRVKFIAIK